MMANLIQVQNESIGFVEHCDFLWNPVWHRNSRILAATLDPANKSQDVGVFDELSISHNIIIYKRILWDSLGSIL